MELRGDYAPDGCMSVPEASCYVGIGEQSFRQYVLKAKEIPFMHLGKTAFYVRKEDVDSWIGKCIEERREVFVRQANRKGRPKKRML